MAFNRMLLCLFLIVTSSVIFIRHVDAVIDIDKRTRGIPMSDTNEGNKFCFSFVESLQTVEETKYIGIYIGTMEPNPVQYRIRSGVTGVNRMGTVQPGEIKRERYSASPSQTNMMPVFDGTDPKNLLTGIIVETVNKSQKISVMGFNDATASQDGFTAVPIINVTEYVPNFRSKYEYPAFTSQSELQGILFAVACNDLPAGAITFNNNNLVPGYFHQSQFFSLPFHPTTSTANALSTFNTIVFSRGNANNVALSDQLTGVKFETTQAVGVMTGHQCGNVPLGTVSSCDHMVEQVPPSYTWGYNFLIAPFYGRTTGYTIRIIPRYDGTNFNIRCTNGTNVDFNLPITNFVRSERLMNNRAIFVLNTQAYCCIQSDRPLAIMQYSKGHTDDDRTTKQQTIGDPSMTWVPAVSQYLNRHLFSNDVSLHSLAAQRVFYYGIYVTVLENCFNANQILLNGTALEPDTSRWRPISCYDDTETPCAYGIAYSMDALPVGSHLVVHANSSCKINVGVHGSGNQKGFAYPAGFGMGPVGETFYSIVPVISSALESVRQVSAIVYKSGDLTQFSQVSVSTFQLSGSNAALIGTDLSSQTYTVSFAAGESSKPVTFNFTNDNLTETNELFGARINENSDIHIGSPSSVEFTIIDDDLVVPNIMFNPIVYNTIEGSTDTVVYINATTSANVTEETIIRITDVPLNGGATRNTDYTGFNATITLQPGESSYSFPVTIRSNPESEPTESFEVTMSRESGGDINVVGGNARVDIQDANILSLSSSSYNVTEGMRQVTITVTASRPVQEDTVVSITDTSGSATGTDYVSINRMLTIPSGQTSVSYNATIIDDSNPELTESFQVQLGLQSGSGVVINPQSSLSTVTIFDDDSTQLSFTSTNYIVNENNGTVYVCVQKNSTTEMDIQLTIRAFQDMPFTAMTSALDGRDFVSGSRQVTLPRDAQQVCTEFTIRDDILALEGNETFSLSFTTTNVPAGLSITQTGTSQVTIVDNDRTEVFIPGTNPNTDDITVPESAGNVTVCVNRTVPIPFNTTATFTSMERSTGTDRASSPQDFTAVNITVLFPANATQVCASIPIIDDNRVESNESFTVSVSIPDGHTPMTVQTTVVITDDDLNIMFNPIVYSTIEGSTDTVVYINATTSMPVRELTVIRITDVPLNGGATRNSDYTGFNTTITLQPGESSYSFPVTIRSNPESEPTESFEVTMSHESGGDINVVGGNARVDIQDANILSLSSSSYNVTEGMGQVTITVTASRPVQEDTVVTITDTSGSATGTDYVSINRMLTIPSGQTSVSYNATIIDDSNPELTESFQVQLGLQSGSGAVINPQSSLSTVTIFDDDSTQLSFTSTNYIVNENNGTVYVCVQKNSTTEMDIQLTIRAFQDMPFTAMTSALNGSDFVAGSSQVTLPRDAQQVCTEFTIRDDILALEGNETFSLSFTTTNVPAGLSITRSGTSQVTIVDNDRTEVFIPGTNPNTDDITVPESAGSVTVCVNRTVPIPFNTTATFTSMERSTGTDRASSPQDFTAVNITVLFPANATQVCASIPIIDDNRVESNESFTVSVSIPDGHTPMTVQTTVVITDDDSATIEFTSSRYTYSESIERGDVCVRTTKPLNEDVVIRLTTDDRSPANATAGMDYVSLNQTMTLPAGQRQVCFGVQIISDNMAEQDEFFYGMFTVENAQQLQSTFGGKLTIRSGAPAEVFIVDPSGCQTVIADVMFVIDESRSIPTSQYRVVKDFSASILQNFPVSADGTHVGVIRFSSGPRTEVVSQLGADNNVTSLSETIKNLEDSFIMRGGETHHRQAMELAISEIMTRGRDGSQKIIILITDGNPEPSDTQSAINVSRDARLNLNYDIFAVGVFLADLGEAARDSGEAELLAITGEPDRFEIVDNFASLNSTLANTILRQVCPEAQFETENVTVHENNGTVTVCLTRSGDLSSDVPLSIRTQERRPPQPPNDAIGDFDFPLVMITDRVYPRGVTRHCFMFEITDDNIGGEPNEVFQVMFNSTTNSATATANVTIIDDDRLTVTFEQSRYEGAEGSVQRICVVLSHIPDTSPVTVPLMVVNTAGTNINPAESTDYSGVPSTVTFNHTKLRDCFDVQLITDTIYERQELFNISLGFPNPSNVGPGPIPSTTVVINDANIPMITGGGPIIGIGSNITVMEGTEATVCVTLNGTSTTSTEVPIHITFRPMEKPNARYPAQSNDYDNTIRTATIQPGQTEACVDVPTNRDIRDENDEQFCVSVTSFDSNVMFIPDTCQNMVTIIDNKRCVTYFADIMLVIDESSSILPANMIVIQNFVRNLIGQYRVSSIETNIGLLRFSSTDRTQVDINLNQYTDRDELLAAVTAISFAERDRGTQTRHKDAIQLAVQELQRNGRPDAADFIILVTDGEPVPADQSARTVAAMAKDNDISIYGIYIGNVAFAIEEVTAISSPGRVFPINNFAALNDVLDEVIRTNCTSVEVTFVTENIKVNEDNGTITACLRKEGSSVEDVTLTILTRERPTGPMSLNARAGMDYTHAEFTNMIFPRNQTIMCFNFSITDDDIGEPNEVFQVMFSITSQSHIAYTDRPIANVTICDNDPTGLSFTLMDYCVDENVTTGVVNVCVRKNITTAFDIPLTIRALPDDPFIPRGSLLLETASARPGSDFEPQIHSLVILDGNEMEQCVDFRILDDFFAGEGNETFRVHFSTQLPNVNITREGYSKVTIKDDDTRGSTLDIDPNTKNVIVPESAGNVTVCVNRTNRFDFDVNATFTSIQKTPPGPDIAIDGVDFVAETKIVEFPSGDLKICTTFRIIDDNIVEKNETFLVNITLPGHVPSLLQANVTITDEGDSAVLEFASSRYRYLETVGQGPVCVRSTRPFSQDIDIRLTTDDSPPANATAGMDYVSHNEVKTLPAGETELCYNVTILQDNFQEQEEFFYGRFAVTDMTELVDCYGGRVDVMSSNPAEIFIYELPSDCQTVIADVMFVIDESRSIPTSQYRVVKDFSASILQNFPVSADGTHVGVIRFSSGPRTEVVSQLGADNNVTSLSETIKNLEDSFIMRGGETHHRQAMELAVSEIMTRGRDGSQKVIILITDGNPEPSNTQSAINVSTDARLNLNYDIFAVGVFVADLGQAARDRGEAELLAITGANDRSFVVDDFAALNSTLTNIILRQVCDTENETVCIVQDSLRVSPFHPSGRPRGMYNFRGTCEHVLAKPCNNSNYVIVGDFLSQDLSMGRVGIRTLSGFSLIDESLAVRSSTPPPQGITVAMERDGNGNVTKVTLTYASEGVRIERTSTDIRIFAREGEICGLCGSLDGILVSSDGMTLNDVMNQTRVNTFASSWLTPANEQILREDRVECAVIKNDTVIGDPLFEARLWVGESTCNYSLCYEIHGESDQHFNLVSDTCVSVNAHYTAMRNPSDGNIISAIGIVASDDNDQCRQIEIVQDQTTGQCVTRINGGSPLSIGADMTMAGINVKQRMSSRVRVRVPNCERIPLVMWITCQNMSGELMMRFDISRAVNLRPTSHGLLGQFYNIRMQAQRFTNSTIISRLDPTYYDINNLWVITVTPPNGSPMRRFIGELYERAWDNSRSPCLYAGTSQGGAAVEFNELYKDTVIEGHYSHYAVANRFATNFRYERFDESRC